MNEEKDNKDKESPESGQACFPTEIAGVDGFIADMLERYGADVGDSLFAGDSAFRDAAAGLLDAVVTFVLDYLPDEYIPPELRSTCWTTAPGRMTDRSETPSTSPSLSL